MLINYLYKDILATVFSLIARAPRLMCVCKHWKHILDSQTFIRLWEHNHIMQMKHVKVIPLTILERKRTDYEESLCQVFMLQTMNLLPYSGYVVEHCYEYDWTIHKYHQGKLIQTYYSDECSFIYYDYMGYTWTKHVTSSNYEDDTNIISDISYFKRRKGYNNEHHWKIKDSCEWDDYNFIPERIKLNLDDHNCFWIELNNGKKVYYIDNGNVFLIKRKKVGIQNNRSRMQVIEEKLIPKPVSCVRFTKLPLWMTQSQDEIQKLFRSIIHYDNPWSPKYTMPVVHPQ